MSTTINEYLNKVKEPGARKALQDLFEKTLYAEDCTPKESTYRDAMTDHSITTGTYQSTADGGVILSSTNTYNAAFLADDSGSNIADSVRNLLARTLLTYNQSGGSIRSVMGQLKLLTGINVATGIYTAVQGYLEMAGSHSCSSGATFSCFDASAEITGVLTVASGGEFYGVHIETTGAGTITNNGTCAAIGITTASGAADWPVGLYILGPSVTTAISVGTKANAVGSGVVIPSTDDWGAVRIFTDDNGANIADSVRGLQSRTLFTISQSAGSIRAVQGQFKVLTGVNFDTGVYTPVQGYIELAGTNTVSSAGVLTCFDASIEIGTALTATGYVAGYKAELTGAGTCAAGLDCGFLVTNASGAAAWTYGMYVEASAVDTGLYVGTCTTGININGTTVTGLNITNAVLGVTDSRAIKVSTSTAAANMADGYGVVEVDCTMTGTAGSSTFPMSGISSWINISSGAVIGAGKTVSAMNVGIYEDAGATVTNAKLVFGMRAHKLIGDTDSLSFPFSLNTNNTAITAVFDVGTATDMGLASGAASAGGAKIPFLRETDGTIYYINVYTS